MTEITITVQKNQAKAQLTGCITAGMVGVPVKFQFDEAWDKLDKVAVFKCGSMVRSRLLRGASTTLPWEVLWRPGLQLQIGVEGRRPDCTLVVPTTWASVTKVLESVDKATAPAKDPSPTVYDDVMNQMGDFARSMDRFRLEVETEIDRLERIRTAGGDFAPAGHIDGFHEYTNLSDVELNKMLMTMACNTESGKQDRSIISINEDGLALDRGYWFFETTKKGRETQLQGRLGYKTAYRTFHDSRIRNGFFEEIQNIPGWTSTDNSVTCISSEKVAYGNYAVKFTDKRRDAGGQLHSDSMAVEAGKEYTATGQFCGVAGGEYAQVCIFFYDASGVKVYGGGDPVKALKDSWLPISHTAKAPAGAVSATVVLATTKDTIGTVYFDDISFSGADGKNLLINGGFESSVAVPGWNTSALVALGNLVSLSREYVGDSNGRGVLKVVDNDAKNGIWVWSDKVSATAGITYTASAIVCGGEQLPDVQICVRFFDAAGNKIGGAASPVINAQTGLQTGEWIDISAYYATAPENTTQMDVLICTSSGATGTLYIDNVTLTAEGDPKPGLSDWAIVDARQMANSPIYESQVERNEWSCDDYDLHESVYDYATEQPHRRVKRFDIYLYGGSNDMWYYVRVPVRLMNSYPNNELRAFMALNGYSSGQEQDALIVKLDAENFWSIIAPDNTRAMYIAAY